MFFIKNAPSFARVKLRLKAELPCDAVYNSLRDGFCEKVLKRDRSVFNSNLLSRTFLGCCLLH